MSLHFSRNSDHNLAICMTVAVVKEGKALFVFVLLLLF